MTSLPSNTQHRLMKLTQIPSVWEGDRRTLQGGDHGLDGESTPSGDCVLWVDGSEGMVRSMDIVSSDSGPEAIVRTLIRAMESPRRPGAPARPQKIVVRNREIQFFLRGALQSLDIAIDYVPELPLIDELFRSFDTPENSRPATLPPAYSNALKQAALELWTIEPWHYLADHEIISLAFEQEQTPQTLYACIMGMLGEEYGVIFYRSLESLKQFRGAALEDQSSERMEQAFLSQDCWFLNYEALNFDLDEDGDDIGDLSPDELVPHFGSIHPLEGIRPFLDEEEAIIIHYALEALNRFVQQHHKKLSQDPVGEVKQRISIPTFQSNGKSKDKVVLTVSTLPDLAQELMAMIDDEDDEDDDSPPFRDDLVPANAHISLGMIPWEIRDLLLEHPKTYAQHQDSAPAPQEGQEFPVFIVQTSRPKAQELIARLKDEGGAVGLGFIEGEDSWTDTHYDLSVVKTQEGTLYLLGEFLSDSPTHQIARKKWSKRCQLSQGYCGLLVTMGVSGRSRGNPQTKDMLGFFEMAYLSPEELGLGVLKLIPQLDMDW